MISLYVLTDPRNDEPHTLWALERALKGAPGRVGLCVRHQDPALALEVAALAIEHHAPCFVAARPDGHSRRDYVHVGALREGDVVPAGAYTASAHDLVEANRASTAQALFVGPIYSVPGKSPPRATTLLMDVRRALPKMPIYALGGVGHDQIDPCVRAGADGIAVIRAIMNVEDPAKAADELVKEIDRARLAFRNRSRLPTMH
jgi:thiamine monophosphate synthase